MALVEVLLGILIANLVEVLAHKYILHGLGKKKTSMFSHHFFQHHVEARKNNFFDKSYLDSFISKGPRGKEFGQVVLLLVVTFPTVFLSVPMYVTFVLYATSYLVLHKCMHLYPKWGKKHFPWHWNHHMLNQNKSWGVVLPLWDWVLGTNE